MVLSINHGCTHMHDACNIANFKLQESCAIAKMTAQCALWALDL